MKKILIIFLLFISIPIVTAQTYVKDKEKEVTLTEEVDEISDELKLTPNAQSAIMIESSTGKVIYEKNANEQLAPASMTKMMTLLLIMENIENKNLKWDELVTTT